MAMTVQRSGHQAKKRPTRVTGRKLAKPAPLSVRERFGLDPRDGARVRVAMMAGSTANVIELLGTASLFVDSADAMEDLREAHGELSAMRERIRRRGEYHAARALRVNRLKSAEHNGYPLRRTQLVVFNRDVGRVTARFSEVAAPLKITGIGIDRARALSDLERQFDRLVREKVRIPPHARREQDDLVRLIVNHLVDWDRFEQENPTPQLLVGRIAQHGRTLRPLVYWLIGPGAIRNDTARLPHRLVTPSFLSLKDGKWFRAVMLEYPDRVEWIEPPTSCPDPTDPETRRAAWEAIPRIVAGTPDVWPLKGS